MEPEVEVTVNGTKTDFRNVVDYIRALIDNEVLEPEEVEFLHQFVDSFESAIKSAT
jgi:hypothetical protein